MNGQTLNGGYRTIISITCLLAASMGLAQDSPPSSNAGDDVRLPELRKELLERVEKDQEARKALIALMQKQSGNNQGNPVAIKNSDAPAVNELKKIDSENTARLKEIVDHHGWPGKSLVGADGAHAAWLLVQHADADPDFQKNCLQLMKKAGPDEVSGQDLAYLSDRVSIKENGKQVYGTQVQRVEGKWQPLPLIDAENVDKLRAEVGLPTLDEYLKFVAKMYKQQQDK